jgi:hypothetical protein
MNDLRVFTFGPFTLYRCGNGHLDVSLTRFKESGWGWEYGPDIGLDSDAWIDIKILGLHVFRLEAWMWGFDIRMMGFWWIV